MLALVAPGQGSQTPGFLAPWLELEFAKDLLNHWSDLIELDLLRLGTTADADEIRETSNAQPLLVAAGLIGASAIFGENESAISVVAGHSVGEITAAAIAHVLTSQDALKLVRARGVEMSRAAMGSETGMSALLGGDRETIIGALAELGLTAANENGAGQIVAAGKLSALAQLAENPPTGSRVRPLAVSGAFHTSVMQPAVAVLSELASHLTTKDPSFSILSNKEGAEISTGGEVLSRIVGQIAGPVRWDLCMDTLATMGVTGVIELPPAGTLVGLIKRAHPEIETFALKTPEDIATAREFAERHGAK